MRSVSIIQVRDGVAWALRYQCKVVRFEVYFEDRVNKTIDELDVREKKEGKGDLKVSTPRS